jgi:hypothetical protein
MSRIASRLSELGVTLPLPMQAPDGIKLTFPWINVRSERVLISGHLRRARTARWPNRSAGSARR